MPSTLPRRAVIALTEYNKVFYEDGKKTGLFWSEAVHPFNVFRAAGIDVDLVSERGRTPVGMDDHSLEGDFLDAESKEAWESSDHPLRARMMKDVLKASDVDASRYGIFFAAGGHGAVFDFPDARGLQDLAARIYDAGGIVAAVCHGPAVLPGVKDVKTGKPLIQGKKITGFTDKGEDELNLSDTMARNCVRTIRAVAVEVGATYVEVRPSQFV